MSENINFIPATELPEAEGDEVSVLCVENGELKQKAASGLGGGGSTNYDIVVRMVTSYNEEEGYVEATGEIVSGSFDAVVQKLDAGIMPIGLCIRTGMDEGNVELKSVLEFRPEWIKRPETADPNILFSAWGATVFVFPDGTTLLL